ncbi:MAG: sugar isomerase domain-containing protein [Candidatus Hydrogenedens sp.]|nr:sugar isomerase domain-containing protein [Candidatus Hydrogenedens sp.]
MSAYLDRYFAAAENILRGIREQERASIEEAGRMVAGSLAEGGIWSVYDTGHLLQHEAHIRAGGLIALTHFGFELVVDHPTLRPDTGEQAPGDLTAREIAVALDRSRLREADVLLINSNSGRTANVIELALQCRERGIRTIGLFSRAQMTRSEAAHATGKKLDAVVDLGIDNHSPYGDAMVSVQGPDAMCPASGWSSAIVLWAIQAQAVALLEERGLTPAIYRSVHVSGQAYIDQQVEHYRRNGL